MKIYLDDGKAYEADKLYQLIIDRKSFIITDTISPALTKYSIINILKRYKLAYTTVLFDKNALYLIRFIKSLIVTFLYLILVFITGVCFNKYGLKSVNYYLDNHSPAYLSLKLDGGDDRKYKIEEKSGHYYSDAIQLGDTVYVLNGSNSDIIILCLSMMIWGLIFILILILKKKKIFRRNDYIIVLNPISKTVTCISKLSM